MTKLLKTSFDTPINKPLNTSVLQEITKYFIINLLIKKINCNFALHFPKRSGNIVQKNFIKNEYLKLQNRIRQQRDSH